MNEEPQLAKLLGWSSVGGASVSCETPLQYQFPPAVAREFIDWLAADNPDIVVVRSDSPLR